MTPDLIAAFQRNLATYHITPRFFAGDWTEFPPTPEAPYDLVLASETIYAPSTQDSFMACLQRLVHPTPAPGPDARLLPLPGNSTVLVAAKVIYFGVGGSVATFTSSVKRSSGWVSPVLEMNEGVGRVVLAVGWPGSS